MNEIEEETMLPHCASNTQVGKPVQKGNGLNEFYNKLSTSDFLWATAKRSYLF